MQANLRKLGALIAKDAADLAKNPTMILCVLMPVGFAVFYRFFIGDMGSICAATEAWARAPR